MRSEYMQKIVKSQAALAHDHFLNLYVNDQRKRDKRPTSKHNDGTEFDYEAKRDSRFAAYGSVVLQRFEFLKVCMGKTVIEIMAKILIYFCNKNDLPQYLVVFYIVFSLLSSIGSLLGELSLFGFPLLS